jgi:hypothetical protein
MGATFSLIVGTFESSGVGTAYGVNTLGAALAALRLRLDGD